MRQSFNEPCIRKYKVMGVRKIDYTLATLIARSELLASMTPVTVCLFNRMTIKVASNDNTVVSRQVTNLFIEKLPKGIFPGIRLNYLWCVRGEEVNISIS